jgi:hypothetical protein
MDIKITDLPLKTTPLAGTDLLEVAEDQGGGVFISKKMPGVLIPSGGGGTAFTYEIGEYVASEGGIIACRWLSSSPLGPPTSGTVQNYLVVNLSDVSAAAGWGFSSGLVGANSLFDGQSNTSLIAPASAAGTASVLCDSLVSGGKSDWYLPATDEWIKIFQNRWEINQALFTYGTEISLNIYWSSTEISGSNALSFSSITGTPQSLTKSNTLYVRALRKFSI